MKREALRHEFVDNIPDQLAEGTVYISIPFATVVHSCCCGCGNEVVTPLGPTDWQLVFDGESISLTPSIGNWSLPCRSHYWIRRNQVKWATRWSAEEIARARTADQHTKQEYFASRARQSTKEEPSTRPRSRLTRFLKRLLRRWRRGRSSED